jgi:hypothetical protein
MPKVRIPRKSPGKTPAIVAMANVLGLTVPEIIAALRDPALWEIYGGGFGNLSPQLVALTESAKQELITTLDNTISSLSKRLEAGDVSAAPHILRLALHRASLRSTSHQ